VHRRGLFLCLLFALPAGLAPVPATAQTSGTPARPSAQYLPFKRLREGIKGGFHWDNEWVNNLSGGVQNGSAFDSVFQGGLAVQTGALGLWRSGQIQASVLGIRSGQPSTKYVGDVQGISNLEASPDSMRLYDLFLHQPLGRTTAMNAGIFDLNAYFNVTNAAGALLNASFGINPALTLNVPVSTYPQTGYGAMLAHRIGHWTLKTGLFQGDPAARGSPFTNGYLAIGEVGYHKPGNYPGRYHFGLWSYNQPRNGLGPHNDWGGYAVVEQVITRGPHPRTTLFLQLGHAPDRVNLATDYVAGGVDVHAPVASRPKDRFTLGFARVELRNLKPETSIEAAYIVFVSRHFFLEPDIQHVVHPGGDLPDATVITLRAHLEFY
jgi:porin